LQAAGHARRDVEENKVRRRSLLRYFYIVFPAPSFRYFCLLLAEMGKVMMRMGCDAAAWKS